MTRALAIGAALAAGAALLPGVAVAATPQVAPPSTPSFATATAGAIATASAATAPAPTPKVVGNRLIDTRTNAVWTPRGVDFPSFEYACSQGWGYSNGTDTDAAASAMHDDWAIDVVRLPLNEGCWTGHVGEPAYGTAAGYRAAVERWVTTLHRHGIAVILDLHWTKPPGGDTYDQHAAPSANSTPFWSSVAATFRSDRSVMLDLFNEPYSVWAQRSNGDWYQPFALTWDCWRDGGCHAPVEDQNVDPADWSGRTYTVVGMQSLVTTVHKAGATQPILLGGLEYANDLSGWWAHRPADSQLVASYHGYEGNTCSATDCWSSTLAALATHAPLIAGEFGSTDGNVSYLTSFMQWADAHSVGYAAWAWWGADSDGGPNRYLTLLDGDSYEPLAPTGTTLHQHLTAVRAASTTPATGLLTSTSRRDSRTVSMSGWALDADTTDTVQVVITLSGYDRQTVAASVSRAPASGYAAWGDHRGFAVRLDVLHPGAHPVCAWAVDAGGDRRTLLGCATVTT